MKFLCES